MIANDSYEIQLRVNNQAVELDVNQFGFRINSSIWEILPKVDFYVQDNSGYLQEFLISVPGTFVEIFIRYEGVSKKIPLMIRSDYLPQSENPQFTGGTLTVPMIHQWMFYQNPLLDSYDDRISGVVRSLASKFPFSSVNINDTENDNYWYQSLFSDVEFIEEVLLPRAFSRNSKKTPFFAFIDSFNEFNFRNYNSLITQTPVATLEYKFTSQVGTSPNNISVLGRKRKDWIENDYYHNVNSYGISLTDGTTIEENHTIDDYSDKPTGSFVPYKKDADVSAFLYFQKIYSSDDIEGKRIFSQRRSISQDQFLLIVPYNPLLAAGRTVNLKIYTNNTRTGDLETSSQFSGLYLIEKETTIWDGENEAMLSQVLISRKYAKYTSNYLLKNTLR